MNNYCIIPSADTTHETAEDWWDGYGWHLSTEESGDITLQAVGYDLLDSPEAAIAALQQKHPRLGEDEAEAIVEMAFKIKEAAEAIESLLKQAVEAYTSGDLVAVIQSLDKCRSLESQHGDSPATKSLQEQLLLEDEDEE